MSQTLLAHAKRVVVKIGSSLLVDGANGTLRRTWLESLTADLATLKRRGKDIIIVSSGAIALGRRVMALPDGVLKLEQAQAAAAVGQLRLAHAYEEAFRPHGLKIAQILVTPWDTEDRRRYLNARSTMETLVKYGVVPVVNENDTVATHEIRYGDNDRLAARVAQMMSADMLVLFSDVDGLYTADPRNDDTARFIPEVRAITRELEAMAGDAGPKTQAQMGSGGMATKLAAGKIALGAGCHMAIASGKIMHPLNAIETGAARATYFIAQGSPRTARKQWIAASLTPQGTLTLDAGAVTALRQGKSLLPAGVRAVSGTFERGDAVIVKGPEGREIARGLTAYSSADAQIIKGRKSQDIEAILGYRGRDEMIHRDDLALHEDNDEAGANAK